MACGRPVPQRRSSTRADISAGIRGGVDGNADIRAAFGGPQPTGMRAKPQVEQRIPTLSFKQGAPPFSPPPRADPSFHPRSTTRRLQIGVAGGAFLLVVIFFYSVIHRGRSTSQSRLAIARRTAASLPDPPVIRPQNDEDEEESTEGEGKQARGGVGKDDDPDQDPPSPPPSSPATVHIVATGGRGAARGDEEVIIQADQEGKAAREGAGADDDPDQSPPSPPPSTPASIHIVVSGGRSAAHGERDAVVGPLQKVTSEVCDPPPASHTPHRVSHADPTDPSHHHPSRSGTRPTCRRLRSSGNGERRGFASSASSYRRLQRWTAKAGARRFRHLYNKQKHRRGSM